MTSVKYILAICLNLVFCLGFSETQSYQIKLAGFNIGTLNATHVKVKNIDYYTITSNVSVNLFVKVKVYYKTITIYKDNKLVESKVNSLVNGKQYYSTTLWDGHCYKINCNTYKYTFTDSSRTESINWSVSKLYFEKPIAGAEVYAETYGKLSQLKLEKNNQLRFEIPKSKQIYYYSEDGELTSVEMINAIKNFNLVKSNI